jgi:hypothetical protein
MPRQYKPKNVGFGVHADRFASSSGIQAFGVDNPD